MGRRIKGWHEGQQHTKALPSGDTWHKLWVIYPVLKCKIILHKAKAHIIKGDPPPQPTPQQLLDHGMALVMWQGNSTADHFAGKGAAVTQIPGPEAALVAKAGKGTYLICHRLIHIVSNFFKKFSIYCQINTYFYVIIIYQKNVVFNKSFFKFSIRMKLLPERKRVALHFQLYIDF